MTTPGERRQAQLKAMKRTSDRIHATAALDNLLTHFDGSADSNHRADGLALRYGLIEVGHDACYGPLYAIDPTYLPEGLKR